MSSDTRRPPALPESGLLRTALPRALEHLRVMEDPAARLLFGAELLSMILRAAEELQAGELEIKVCCGLQTMPTDPDAERPRSRPLLPLVAPPGRGRRAK